LQQHFVGKDISIKTGSVVIKNGVPQYDSDARPIFANGSSTSTYRIQGSAANCSTPDAAAFDALAMARVVAAARGDGGERTGYIVTRPNGSYTYEYPYQLAGQWYKKLIQSGAS